MRWVAVTGEAMAVLVVVLVLLCRHGMTDDAYQCDGDEQDCGDPMRRVHHLYRRDNHHDNSQGRHPRDTRTSTPPGHDTNPVHGTPPGHDTNPVHGTPPGQDSPSGHDSPPGHGTNTDSNTTMDSKLDHETGSHDTSLDPEHKTTPYADLETTLDPDHGTPFGSDHEGTKDPELDLETHDHDAVVDPNETTLDPDHEGAFDSDHATTPESDQDPLGTTLDPGLLDLEHETSPDPDEDSGYDPLDTTIDPGLKITLDSDHEPTYDETTPDTSVPLARQGTSRVKVPPPVGADNYPMRYAGMGARRSKNPRPPGLPPNILQQRAFTVKKARYTRAVTQDLTLTFSELVTNLGNAYIKYGLFFCPIDAGYYFSWHATARKGYGFTLELRVNRKAVVQTRVSNGTMESASNSVFLELERNDIVSLHLLKGGAIHEGADAYTTFVGFLFSLRRRNEV